MWIEKRSKMTIQGVFLLITVCIWLLNLFPLNGNSIASKGLSTNSDLQSSHQLEENTEYRREAMLDLAAKLQTTESTLQPTISTTAPPCNCRKYCPAANSTGLEVIKLSPFVFNLDVQRCMINKDSGYMTYWRAILSSQILKLKHFYPSLHFSAEQTISTSPRVRIAILIKRNDNNFISHFGVA